MPPPPAPAATVGPRADLCHTSRGHESPTLAIPSGPYATSTCYNCPRRRPASYAGGASLSGALAGPPAPRSSPCGTHVAAGWTPMSIGWRSLLLDVAVCSGSCGQSRRWVISSELSARVRGRCRAVSSRAAAGAAMQSCPRARATQPHAGRTSAPSGDARVCCNRPRRASRPSQQPVERRRRLLHTALRCRAAACRRRRSKRAGGSLGQQHLGDGGADLGEPCRCPADDARRRAAGWQRMPSSHKLARIRRRRLHFTRRISCISHISS